ncbi:hypothetical protein D3C86_1577460 [compost metagenome]
MGDRLFDAFGIQRHLPHRQCLADLHQPALADDAPIRRRLAQEVDGQASGDCQRHDADFAQQGDVQRHVGQPHEGWPGDGAARAQIGFRDVLGHRGALVADGFDNDTGLREFCPDEMRDGFFAGHVVSPEILKYLPLEHMPLHRGQVRDAILSMYSGNRASRSDTHLGNSKVNASRNPQPSAPFSGLSAQ